MGGSGTVAVVESPSLPPSSPAPSSPPPPAAPGADFAVQLKFTFSNATRAQVEAAFPAIKTELATKYSVTESQIGLAIEETSTRRRMLSSTITLIVTITTESRTAATTLANAVDAANAVGISTLGGLDVDSVTSAVVIYVNPDDDDDGLSGEVIAGIAVGTCAGVALIAVIAVMVFKKK